MKQSFTPNHLLKFLYNETGTAQSLAIGEALQEDASLRHEFGEILQGYQQLPRVQFRPSGKTIQNILKYSACQPVEG